ncbi:MAG TPA: hypothetical protein VHC97_23450 [Thermoanaerobaculia bacterium]|jgi:hypothetical protein|nr:hypothetical protein [Thermoanaerobaculia bacterium]
MKDRDLDSIRFVTRHFNDLQGLRYWVPVGLITLSLGGTTYFANRPFVILRAVLFLGAFLLAFGARRYYRNVFGEVERRTALPAAELYPVPIFSPAGTTPRLEGFHRMTPAARHLLATMGLAFTLFFILQAITPTIMIEVDESLVQPPWSTLDSVFLFNESWTRGIGSIVARGPLPPSTVKAVLGQMMYALYGSFFVGLWLWRGRRPSQSCHLALGVLLLGLALFGTFLGYFVYADGLRYWVANLFVPPVVHLWVALLLCGSSMILAGLLDHRQLVRTLGRPAAQAGD